METNYGDIIQLKDENGNDVEFEHIMTIEHGGEYYVMLESRQDIEDCREGEAIILRIKRGDDGEDLYVTIDNEEEYEAVSEKFIAAIEAEDEANDED